MSSIDDRVVQMHFNNRQFEDGIQTSTKSLEALKKSLDMEYQIKQLDALNKIASNTTPIQGMAEGVGVVAKRFGALGIAGMTVISNLTSSAMDFASRTTSMIIDPMLEGGRRRALNIEQAKFQFKGLGMDVEKTMESANQAVLGTAYGLDEAARVAGQFGASGMQAGDEMTKSLRAVSGVAAMTNSEYGDMGRIFTTVAGNGRLMGDQLLQLSNRGINAAAVMGEQFDKSEAEIRELVSKGQISFKMFYTAMDNAFGEHATRANETYTGSLANMKAALSRIGADIQAAKLDNMRDVFNAMSPAINKARVALKPLIANMIAADTASKQFFISIINSISLQELENIFHGVNNIYESFLTIVNALKEAIFEMFPGKQKHEIVWMTNSFLLFTERLKITEKTADNLKRVFKGVIAIFDIVIMAVSSITKALFGLVNVSTPVSGGILELIANFADLVVAFRDNIKQIDIFGTGLDAIGQKVGGAAKKFAEAIEFIKTGDVSLPMSTDGKALSDINKPIVTFTDFMLSAGNTIDGVGKRIGQAVTYTVGKLKEFRTYLEETFKFDFNVDNTTKIINSLLLGGVFIGIKKFVDNITNSIKGISDGVIGILTGVKDVLKAYQADIKANVLLKIAGAVAILTGSLILLSGLDAKQLTLSLLTIAGILGMLFNTMTMFGSITGLAGFAGLVKVSTGLIGLGIAIFILSGAIKRLSSTDLVGAATGILSLAAIIGLLILATKNINFAAEGLIKGSFGLIVFSTALTILVGSITKLTALAKTPKELGIAMAALAGMIGALILFTKYAKLANMTITGAASVLVLAGAILVLLEAVKQISKIDPVVFLQGVGGLGVLLGVLSLFSNYTQLNAAGLASILALSVGLVILFGVLQNIAEYDPNSFLRGVGGLGVMLAVLALFANQIQLHSVSILSMIALVGGIKILTGSLERMAELSWNQIAKSAVALFTTMGILVATMKIAQGISGVSSLPILAIAGALYILSKAFEVVGGLQIGQIGGALLAFGGAAAILVVALWTIAPVIPVLAGFTGALMLLGAAIGIIGISIYALSFALTNISAIGVDAAKSLVASMKEMLTLIPYGLGMVAQGIVSFITELVKGLLDAAPALLKSFTNLFLKILDALVEVTPAILEAGGTLLLSFIKTLLKYAPDIVDAGLKLFIGLLKGLSDNIGDLVVVGVTLIVNLIKGIASMATDIVSAGVELITALINGMATTVETQGPELTDAMFNLISALVGIVVDTLASLPGRLYNIGVDIVEGLIKGIKSRGKDPEDEMAKIAQNMEEATRKELDSDSPAKKFVEIGEDVNAGLALGLAGGAAIPKEAAKEMVEGVVKSSTDAASGAAQAAKNAIAGSNKGIEEELTGAALFNKLQAEYKGVDTTAKKTGKSVVKSTGKAAKSAFEIAKEWISERKYYDEMTLAEELTAWEEQQKKYAANSEERKEIDREVFRVKKELRREDYNNATQYIDDQLYYDKMFLNAELAAWQDIQKKYEEGSDERKKADREVYRLKKELISAEEEYTNQVVELTKNAAEKKIEYENDYYNKVKEINAKLEQDIQNLEDQYDAAVKSRAKSLYDAYSLFDEIKAPENISGTQLTKNLEDQITQFKEWKQTIRELSSKGIDTELMTQLEEMGVKSLGEIKALNTLSGPELDNYVSLWQEKTALAKTQAVKELVDLRHETDDKISALNLQAEIELEEQKTIWETNMKELSEQTLSSLETLKTDFVKKIGILRTETQTEFIQMTDKIIDTIKAPDWQGLGGDVVGGIKEGVKQKAVELADEVARVAKEALDAAKEELGIASPSKEFMDVGRESIMGIVVAVQKFAHLATKASANTGRDMLLAMKEAIDNGLRLLLNQELTAEPVIKPVVDLSDVRAGGLLINQLLSQQSGITLSSIRGKLPVINDAGSTNQNGVNTQQSQPASINFTQNNYSPKALSRLDIYRNTKNQISLLKGVTK